MNEMVVDIQIEGAERIEKALLELAKSGGEPERLLRNATAAGGRLIQNAAKNNISKASHAGLILTGHLRDGIKVRKQSFKKGNIQVNVVSTDPKSYWFEFGTDERYRTGKMRRKKRRAVAATKKAIGDKRGYTGKIKPYGFMRNAFNKHQKEVMDKILNTLEKSIARVAKK